MSRSVPGLDCLWNLLWLLTVLTVGCKESPDTTEAPPSRNTVSRISPTSKTPPEKLAELSRSISQRSPAEIKRLIERLKFDFVPASSPEDKFDEPLQPLADELLSLTLLEADGLGSLLENQGESAELTVMIAERQMRAAEVVKKVQQRLTKPPEGVEQYDVFITAPYGAEELELPWLEKKTGRKYQQVTTLSFAREEYDLGPTQTDLSDVDLKAVGMLTGLRKLDLRESQVTGRGLHELRYLRHLESIDVTRIRAAAADWKPLAQLSGLRELKLQPADETQAEIGWLGQLPHLETLLAYDVALNNDALAGLCDCRSIRILHLVGNTQDHTILFQNLPQLDELHLTLICTQENQPARLKLAHLPKLRHFTTNISNSHKVFVSGLLQQFELIAVPRLQYVHLTAKEVPASGLASLGQLPNLQSLWMTGMTIPGETLRMLEGLDRLTDFGCRTDDGDRALQSLAKIKTLNKLVLSANTISHKGLTAVSELSELKSLVLSSLETTEDVSRDILQLKKLEELVLERSSAPQLSLVDHPAIRDVTFHEVRIERVRLDNLPSLTRIDFRQSETSHFDFSNLPALSWCDISILRPDRIKSFQLTKLPKLKHFSLIPISNRGTISGEEVSPEPIPLGDEFLGQFHSMEQLQNLSLNNVLATDAGLLELGHLVNLGIREFSGPHITEEGRTQLRRAIETSREQSRVEQDTNREEKSQRPFESP